MRTESIAEIRCVPTTSTNTESIDGTKCTIVARVCSDHLGHVQRLGVPTGLEDHHPRPHHQRREQFRTETSKVYGVLRMTVSV